MSERQINRLRRRFTLSSTLAVFFTMVLMGGLISLFSLVTLRSEVRRVMNYIAMNDGDISAPIHQNRTPDTEREPEEAPDELAYTVENIMEFSLSEFFGVNPHSPGSGAFGYSMRYFAVRYDENDNVEDVITHNLDFADEEEMITYAEIVKQRFIHFGSFGKFYYNVTPREKGGTLVIYLDRSGEVLVSNRVLFAVLSLLWLGTLFAFFLMHCFSYKACRPEIENMEKQKQFITNASHELKTPLAVIRANTEMQELEHGETEWTRSTIKQVDRLSGLVENLVQIAKSRENEGKQHCERFDVSKAAEESVEAFRALITQDGKRLEKSIAPGIFCRISESCFRQLLTLLCDNAVKYCDEEGVVRAELEKAGRGFRMTISNSYAEGEGVDYERFFERFYREDESHSAKGGYGIGLSVAESLTKQMGGRLEVGWEKGEVRFRFSVRN